MVYNNEYKTPRERVNDDLRAMTENDMAVFDFISSNPLAKQENHGCCKTNEYQTTRYNKEENTRMRGRGSFTNNVCSCPSLAMIYSPDQDFDDLFDIDLALAHGSLFKGLVFPLEASSCACASPHMKNGGYKR